MADTEPTEPSPQPAVRRRRAPWERSDAIPFDESEHDNLVDRKRAAIKVVQVLSPLLCEVDTVVTTTYYFVDIPIQGSNRAEPDIW